VNSSLLFALCHLSQANTKILRSSLLGQENSSILRLPILPATQPFKAIYWARSMSLVERDIIEGNIRDNWGSIAVRSRDESISCFSHGVINERSYCANRTLNK
jgi:hypothetical protein